MLFSLFLEGCYFRQIEIGQAVDFTPSKIIDLSNCPCHYWILSYLCIGLCERAVTCGMMETSNHQKSTEKRGNALYYRSLSVKKQ